VWVYRPTNIVSAAPSKMPKQNRAIKRLLVCIK